MLRLRPAWIALLAVPILLACSPSGEAGFSGAGGVQGGTAGVGAIAGSGGGWSGACVTSETQPCTCGGTLPGRSVCTSDTWGACECAGGTGGTSGTGGSHDSSGDPLANKNPNVMWNWTESTPAGGCRPGRYEGALFGTYQSSLILGFPISVATTDDPTAGPGLVITLESGGSGEILSVSGGKLRGLANDQYPFEFDVVGALDCGTLRFEADLINGFYVALGLTVEMHGVLTADYDPVTASFVNGQWIFAEPGHPLTPAPILWFGGTGEWNAHHVP